MKFIEYSLGEFAERYGFEGHEFFHFAGDLVDETDFWIAGGAVRALLLNQPITTDVDFFFKSAEACDKFLASCKKDKGFRAVSENEHCVTFKLMREDKWYKVQAIRIAYYENPRACLDTFDFTICQLAVVDYKLIVGEYTLWDLARRRLALHKLTYGAATVRRLLKYTNQGFTACSGCITAILSAVGDDPSLINAETQYVD